MPEALPILTGDSLETLAGLSPRGIRLGLTSIREILARLGSPERRVPRALIAGTNGKGSIAATLSSIFQAAEIPCGLHTSPHLSEVTERVRINDRDVDRANLGSALDRVFQAAAQPPAVPVTYFEAITAASELIFSDFRCQFAVVEVGLGGRLDATNASEPVLSAVASVSLDHVADLGGTVEEIAREKAGIFRAGRPAIGGGRDRATLEVLAEEARRKGSRWIAALDTVRIAHRRETSRGQAFLLETPHGRHEIETPLRGRHQAENLATAVLAAEELRPLFPRLTAEAIRLGASRTRWPGRLEAFAVGGKTVWLDGCHNPAGAAALADFFRGRPPFDLVFAAMEDKDALGIARTLFPLARRVVLAAPAIARAASPASLRARLGHIRPDAEVALSVADALETTMKSDAAEVLVAGSLYLAGEARDLLRR